MKDLRFDNKQSILMFLSNLFKKPYYLYKRFIGNDRVLAGACYILFFLVFLIILSVAISPFIKPRQKPDKPPYLARVVFDWNNQKYIKFYTYTKKEGKYIFYSKGKNIIAEINTDNAEGVVIERNKW